MAENTKTPTTKVTVPHGGAQDRVVMASRLPDGTPDQTADFTYIGDKDVTLEATKAQLGQQASSAIDAEKRAELGLGPNTGDEQPGPDPVVAELQAAHEAVVETAHAQAEAEVEARFDEQDPATRPTPADAKTGSTSSPSHGSGK